MSAATTRPEGAPVRVLIADDHAAIRAGLRLILDSAPDLVVVGEAADGGVAVGNTAALRPDVVLMDVRMPGLDGLAATAAITRAGAAQVLVLTTFDVDEYVFGALRAGAAGFLLKTVEPAELLEAVRRVAAGDAVLAPEATRRLLDAFVALDRRAGEHPGGPAAVVSEAGLTGRETDVLGLLGQGLSNQQISARLHISLGTTKTHVSRVLAKLGCASRTQAAVLARERGVTGPRTLTD